MSHDIRHHLSISLHSRLQLDQHSAYISSIMPAASSQSAVLFTKPLFAQDPIHPTQLRESHKLEYTQYKCEIVSAQPPSYCLFFSRLITCRETSFSTSSNIITGTLMHTTPIHSTLLSGTTEKILAKNGTYRITM